MSILEQVRRIRAGALGNAGGKAGFMAARAWIHWRAAGMRAVRALEQARRDATDERARTLPERAGIGAPGERGGQWVERPEAMGLRFVGFADDIAGTDYGEQAFGRGEQRALARHLPDRVGCASAVRIADLLGVGRCM